MSLPPPGLPDVQFRTEVLPRWCQDVISSNPSPPTVHLQQQRRCWYARPPKYPPPAASVQQQSRYAPPPPSPIGRGLRRRLPMMGTRRLCRRPADLCCGRTLVYPENYLCPKCEPRSTSSLSSDSDSRRQQHRLRELRTLHPCRRSWDRFGVLALLTSSSSSSQGSDSSSQSQDDCPFQRRSPHSSPRMLIPPLFIHTFRSRRLPDPSPPHPPPPRTGPVVMPKCDSPARGRGGHVW